MTEELVKNTVLVSCPKSVVDEFGDYLADLVAGILEDEADNPDAFWDALQDSIVPFLDGNDVSPSEAVAFCESIRSVVFPSSRGSVKVHSDPVELSGADNLCNLQDLMMMYGGSSTPLLKNATLKLVKGHLYGVVGANGTGKSTLINRIANRDIAGLPGSIRVVHLSQDRFLDGISPSTCVRDHVASQCGTANLSQVQHILAGVGVDHEMLAKAVADLSGGWQMRVALACALSQKANLLLLDEPTNHLDAIGIQWLVDFLRSACVGGDGGSAAMIISHDPAFLDQVCTDIIQFTNQGTLAYYPGNFNAFKTEVLQGDEIEAERLLEKVEKFKPPSRAGMDEGIAEEIHFPAPEKIGATAAARKAPILTLEGGAFCYEVGKPIFSDVNVKLSMESRVAIVGGNGAGKSTLLALLADRLQPSSGELWRHKSLRIGYIAQSHLVHLEEALASTPMDYMQARFRCGYDSTVPEKKARELTAKEEADRVRLGIQFGKKSKPVKAVLSRKEQTTSNAGEKRYLYLVDWEGLGTSERSWENRGKLNQCGAAAMVDDLDARLWYAWAGVEQRSTSESEVVKHMTSFGLPENLICHQKISTLSSGQKVKLMFGAALWTRPHLLCLDEPTNFLDVDSVAMLQDALKRYRGCYAIVTHNMSFAEEICNETWTVSGGKLSGAKRIWGKAKNRGN